MTKKMTLKNRMLTMLAKGSVKSIFTLKDLRKKWKPEWHREYSTYKTYGELDNLFMHSFVHDAVRPLREEKVLRRLSYGKYEITKTGERVINSL